MDEAEAQKRVGMTLCDKWTIERLLGVGGMAAVYATKNKIGRRDAIKILHPNVARDKDLRSRFELEAHVANRFRHPGAVEIRDVDTTADGCPFFVMELLDGESLADRASRGPVPVEDVLRWVDALLDVLAAAHAQGIVHRDIKLDNLFVTTDGRLKVLDFGIARVRDSGRAAFAKTAMGARLGTAPYMPPEQVQGREIDGRADIFAVGVTMFRVLARKRIHDAPNEAEMLVKMGSLPAPPLGTVAPFVPENVQLVVDRALRFERDERYPDAKTMRDDVIAVRAGKAPPYATSRADARAAVAAGATIGPGSRVAASPPAAPLGDGPTRVESDTSRSRSFASAKSALESLEGASTSSAPSPPFRRDPTAVSSRSPPSIHYGPAVTSAAVPLVGTLKSAGVVPLPAGPAAPSRHLVDVMSAPAPRRRSRLPLYLFGVAFLLIGAVVTVVLARPAAQPAREPAPAPTPAPAGTLFEDEPDNARRPHPGNPPSHGRKHH